MSEVFTKVALATAVECWSCGITTATIVEWPSEQAGDATRQLCVDCDLELYMDQLNGGSMAVTAPNRVPEAGKSTVWQGNKLPKATPKPPKCNTGHLFSVTFGEDRGKLILASYRGGARLADGADYGLFFYSEWKKAAGRTPIELVPGSDESLGPDLFAELGYTTPPLIIMDWKDYGAPPRVAYDYAKWVSTRILDHKETIQVGCMGGHGRTGTFAAYVLMTTGGKNPDEAIEWVRDKYCHDAIEGNEQVDSIWEYHDWLHGVEVTEGAEA